MELIETIETAKDHTRGDDGSLTQSRSVFKKSSRDLSTVTVLTNITYLLYFVTAGLLGLRMFLTLFIANRSNSFASSIYKLSDPLVSPFRSLFGIDTTIGKSGSRIELETLLAIVIYAFVAYVIVRLININRKDY
jgi:uncharacterized protein YggT (Ycf19 family)